MVHRLLNPSENSSLFIFGARGTGKSTFIVQQFLQKLKSQYLYIDLLDDETEEKFLRNPSLLKSIISSYKIKPTWVVIDEVQKVPRLLDVIHWLIENEKIKFILSGSSARKLKKTGANLLAGRAFEYRIYPFSFYELSDQFDLSESLNFGMLPTIFSFSHKADKIKYLKSYISTYVKLEIQLEQILRKLDPFRNFLEIAAQMNGKPLNFSKISREVGVDTKTIINYYQILEETYLGFLLPAFHTSLRKSVLLTPKFFFFDVGVKRALENSLFSAVVAGTSYYGEIFEQFVIAEAFKLNQYLEADYSFSYFATKEGAEVDLVLSRGKKEILFIEIKSSKNIDRVEVKKLSQLTSKTQIKGYYLSQDPLSQKINGVHCLPWDKGLKEIFNLK